MDSNKTDLKQGESSCYIGCRVYMLEGRMYEFPPKKMIEFAFERLLEKR